MFLEDSFSVVRILILSFFILLVVLASILDICGVVENMSSDPGDSEMSVTADRNVVEESGRGSGVTEKKTIESVLELHQDNESSRDSSQDSTNSLEENKKNDEEIQCVEIVSQEIQEKFELDNQDNNIADVTSNGNEVKTIQGERRKKSVPSALSPIEDKTSKNISRPVNQAPTVRREEHGIMKVLAEAGYRAVAVNILGEMGLDHVDGGAESEDGVRSEDDIVCAGSSRWPGPDHRPDLTSLRCWPGGGDTGDTCQPGGPGEAGAGHQAIGPRDIGIVRPEKNKAGGKTDNLTLILHAFSVKRNLPKIFNITGSSEGDLSCLHGIRFLSMTWVILGHTFYFSLPYVDNPVWALNTIQNSWTMEAVEQGLFSVDSFFFLSGLLVSYIFLKRRKSVDQLTSPLTWVKVILHRYVRLLPPYIALVLLLEPLAYYTCSGPQVYTGYWKHLIHFIGP